MKIKKEKEISLQCFRFVGILFFGVLKLETCDSLFNKIKQKVVNDFPHRSSKKEKRNLELFEPLIWSTSVDLLIYEEFRQSLPSSRDPPFTSRFERRRRTKFAEARSLFARHQPIHQLQDRLPGWPRIALKAQCETRHCWSLFHSERVTPFC